MLVEVTSNHYRMRKDNIIEIELAEPFDRCLNPSVETTFDSPEPLRPSKKTLLCLARHYEKIHRIVHAA